MNKILLFALFFALTNCISVSECKADNSIEGDKIFVEIASNNYENNKEFDWTDDDSFDFKVPLGYNGSGTISMENIIPLFINASVVNTYVSNNEAYGNLTIKGRELSDIKIYDKYPVYYPFDATITDNLVTAKINSGQVKANKNDVKQKFIKYFGFAYCTGEGEAKIKYTHILATFNNGNYFSISKMLLATLALLFL